MKYSLISALILMSICFQNKANAQTDFYVNNGPMEDSLVRSAGVAQLDIYTVYKSKKSESTTRRTYLYNTDGRQIFNVSIADTLRQKKLNYSIHNVYAGSGKQGSVYHYGESRYHYLRLTDYTATGKAAGYRYYNQAGRLSAYSRYTYSDSNLSRISNYRRNGKLRTYYAYTYEGKKVLKYGLYNKKGKLVRLWDYTCTDNARAAKPGKDTVKICTEKSYRADGTVLITTSSFNFRGEPVKYVELQDSLKKRLSYAIYTGKDEILTHRQTMTYSGNALTGMYQWNADRKGKPFYAMVKTYNGSGRVSSETDTMFQYKTPKVLAYTFRFDANGMLSEKTGLVNGRIKTIEYYRYRYYKKD